MPEVNRVKNYGLVLPDEMLAEEYVLGGVGDVPGEIINPEGKWPHPDDKEPQEINNFDTFGCTVWGSLNALETLLKHKGFDVNYSDRYIYSVAVNKGILNPDVGADPHKIAELLRKVTGNLREDRIPNKTDNKVEYYEGLYPILEELVKEGQEWYKTWELKHEWVWTYSENLTPQQKKERLGKALQKGTVCVSVYAWALNENDLYFKPPGARDTHWTLLTASTDQMYEVFDSYDTYQKALEPLFDFGISKVYYLSPVKPKVSLWERFMSWLRNFLSPRTLGAARSGGWKKVRNDFLKENPECAVCGKVGKIISNEAHHIKSFASNPDLELSPENLMTVCRVHHFWFCHLGSWASINESAVEDCKVWREKIQNRP